MKDFISLTAAANRESCTMDDLLRLGSSGDLPMYIEGNQFILSPDFLTSQHRPALAIPLAGLFAFKYNGPIRLSTGAIGIVRDKGSAPTRGPQTFFYLKDHTRENFTPLLSHIHPLYRGLPPSSYDFFYNQKPLYVTLKSSEPKTVGIQGEDLPILVKSNDLARLFTPKAAPNEQRSFEDITIDVAPPADWKDCARAIGEEIYRDNPNLTVSTIAERVHKILIGENITGRGGRVPSAATIRREALIGIKSR